MKLRNKALIGLLSAAAMSLGVQQVGAAVVTQSVDIASDTTWTSADQYYLTQAIFVTNGATLTIQPGTVIRGKNLSNASLIISRGSKIDAQGTAANPIVFTCEGDDNVGANPGTGVWAQKNNGVGKKWGGVILLGKTYIATVGSCPNSNVQQPIEGIATVGDHGYYGGGDDNDDSGVMRYCSLRYGGFILGLSNEINGLTMGGVGRLTDIDHIEVYQNADDAYEWFGGTVCPKYLVGWNSTDDTFDTDEGFRGKGQFFLCVQGLLINDDFNEKSDKGTEEDGAIGNDTNQPSSTPTWFNWTEVGLGRDSGQKKNTCMNIRDGAGVRFYNSLWMDFGGAPALFEGGSSGPQHAGSTGQKFSLDYVAGGLYGAPDVAGVPTSGNGYDHEALDPSGTQTKKAQLMYNVWWKCGTNSAFGCDTNTADLGSVWGTDGSDGNKAFYNPGLFTTASLHDYYLDEAGSNSLPSSISGGPFPSPCAVLTREAAGKTVGDGKTYHQVDVLDPRPRTAFEKELMTYGRVPPNDGFYTPVAFIGAFGKTKNWAQGWTLASRLGLLASGTAGDYTGIVPAVGTNAVNVTVALDCDSSYNGIKADYYLYLDAGTLGKYYYDAAKTSSPLSSRWVRYTTTEPKPSLGNSALGSLGTMGVLEKSVLPAGTYTVTLAIDLAVNTPAAADKIDEMSTFSKSFTFTK